MPKKRYKPISLTAATKILRAHSTQIEPPGLLELKNLYISRSDNAVSLRSDWEPHSEGMFSMSSLIQDSDVEDYLNAAFYVSRAGHTIWFSRLCPFVWDGSTWGLLSSLYADGTITTDGSLRNVVGAGTSWRQKAWPGCFIREKGDGNDLYTIEEIINDELLHTETAMPALTNAEYEILRVHPRYRADWPMRMEALGGYLVYGVADMTQPIDEDYLSGPWFSNIGRPNLGVWIDGSPDVDAPPLKLAGASFLYRYEHCHYGLYAATADLEYSDICVPADHGLFFKKDWLIDAYTTSLEDAPEAKSPAVNVPLGIQNCTITRLQGKWAVTDDGRKIQLAASADETPVYPPLWNTSGAKTLWRSIGGKAWGGPTVSAITTVLAGQVLWGVVRDSTGNNVEVYGDGGYYSGSASGVTTSIFDATTRNTIGGGGAAYVFVGENDGTQATILTAPNPVTNLTQVTGYLADDDLHGVTYSAHLDRFVAVGTSGACITSDDDGATWTTRTIGATKDLQRVCYDPDGYVCVAVGGDDDGGVAYASLDAITWVEITLPSDTERLIGIYYSEHDGYFYFSSESYKVYRWRKTLYFDPTLTYVGEIGSGKGDFVTDIIWTGSLFIAVGSHIWTSPTGVTWTEKVEADNQLLCIVKDDNTGRLIAAGTDGVGYYSLTGGAAWTKTTIDSGGGTIISVVSGSSATYGGKLWAAAMDGNVWSSSNAITWAQDATIGLTEEKIISMERFDAYDLYETGRILVATTDLGNVYCKLVQLYPAYIEYSWAEWTENPGAVGSWNPGTLKQPYDARTNFHSFLALLLFGGNFGPNLCGCSANGQILKTTGTPYGGARTAGTNRAWAVGMGGLAYPTVGAKHCISALYYANTHSPIILYWLSNTFSIGHRLLTSCDWGRTWSTSFRASGSGPDGPGLLLQHNHELILTLKANSSDSSVRAYHFRPIVNDGTDFFIAVSNRWGFRPHFYTLDGGLLLKEPNTGDILEAEEYE